MKAVELPRTGGDADHGDDRSEHEIRDRQMLELLNELRVALPGVQILFAFLLAVPFAQGWERTTAFQRDIFYVTLIATAVSTIFFIAPSAAHRLRFHQRDRAYVIESANTYMILGLAMLALAIAGAVALVTDVLYDGSLVVVVPVLLAAVIVGLWFVRPLVRHARGRASGP